MSATRISDTYTCTFCHRGIPSTALKSDPDYPYPTSIFGVETCEPIVSGYVCPYCGKEVSW